MHPKSKNSTQLDIAHNEQGSISVSLPHVNFVPSSAFGFWHSLKEKISAITATHLIVAAAISSQVLLVAYLIGFMTPKNIQLSYAGDNCVRNNVLLPDLHLASSGVYQLLNSGGLKLGSMQLSSTTTCLVMNDVPVQGSQKITQELALLSFIKQDVEIITPPLPSVKDLSKLETMPTNVPAVFTLDQSDKTFNYALHANKLSSECDVAGTALTCDTDALNLKQSTKYDFKLERSFNGESAGVIIEKNIPTVEAVTIKNSSIKPEQTIYDNPKSLTIEVSKEIAKVSEVKLVNLSTNEPVKTSVATKDKELAISFLEDLPRLSEFQLSIGQIIAPDKSSLASIYSLKFKTSGGPKVAGVSIGTYGVYTNSNITLTLDSSLAAKQNLASYFSITADGKSIDANIYQSGATVTLDPKQNLAKCSTFTVGLKDGIKNSSGITGGSAWTMNFRTICRSESVIGSSVLGRAIVAHTFGNGPSKIVMFGNMHGNEASTKYTLDSWINELEANYHKIPKNRTIIVIPSLNPDGLVAGTRNNARNVDLNRNFPESNWKANVQKPGGGIVDGGGGSVALSEPEAQALANFITAQQPRLVLSYHAIGSVIISNEAGDANSVASKYSSLTGYWLPSGAEAEGVFDYEITGTLEGWLYETYNIPTLVIELPTYYSNHYSSNASALWAMTTLP